MDNITIQECCDSILEIMYSKNYSESSLQSYERIFTDFLRFCETKDIVYIIDKDTKDWTKDDNLMAFLTELSRKK